MNRFIPICVSILVMLGCDMAPKNNKNDIISHINEELIENPSASGGGDIKSANSKIVWNDTPSKLMPVTLQASAVTGISDLIAEYEWDIDGSIYNGENISIELANGKHELRLLVYGQGDEVNTFSYFITVIPDNAGQTYYIDFDGGDDSNDGISQNTPWKHSPGDVNAQALPKSVKILAGDVVIFKGGVHYRGEVFLKGINGEEENPVFFDGNTRGTFGVGQAIFDGSNVLTDWELCSAEVSKVVNSLYCASLPEGATELKANLYQAEKMLTLAQEPNLVDNYKPDDISIFKEVSPKNATQESIVDPNFFTQNSQSSWDGAYVFIWAYGNIVFKTPVTGFIPSENKILFEPISNPVYTDRNTKYAILNHPRALDQLGEYFIYDNIVYLAPYNDMDPEMTQITVSVREVGIDIQKSENIIVQGIVFEKYTGGLKEHNSGVAVRVLGYNDEKSRSRNIFIRNNEIRFLRSMEKKGGIFVQGADFVKISNNYMHHNFKNRGILLTNSTNSSISQNVIYKGGDSGIVILNGSKIDIFGNFLYKQSGVHSSGLTVYMGSNEVNVYRNKIFENNVAIGTQASSNIKIENNILQTYGSHSFTVTDWGKCSNLEYYNNVMMHPKNKAFVVGKSSRLGLKVKNNIIDGHLLGEIGEHISHNLYTKLAWNQQEKYGWFLGEGEMIETDKNKIFVDYVNEDYRPRKDSFILNSGTEVIRYSDRDFSGNYMTNSFIGADGQNTITVSESEQGNKGLVIHFNLSGN